MIISAIVAVSKNGVIGNAGKIPWNLPAEQAIFKQTTMGHPIIMGRKTHESIGRALPGRTNIVITRQKKYQAEGCTVVESLEQAIRSAKEAEGSDEVFIIGGEGIYKEAIPLLGKIYLTEVNADVEGDTFFMFDRSKWQELSRKAHKADDKNPYDYSFVILDRRH